MSKLNDLSKEELVAILKAATVLVDTGFYDAYEIQRQTGLSDEQCDEMARLFSVLRTIDMS